MSDPIHYSLGSILCPYYYNNPIFPLLKLGVQVPFQKHFQDPSELLSGHEGHIFVGLLNLSIGLDDLDFVLLDLPLQSQDCVVLVLQNDIVSFKDPGHPAFEQPPLVSLNDHDTEGPIHYVFVRLYQSVPLKERPCH